MPLRTTIKKKSAGKVEFLYFAPAAIIVGNDQHCEIWKYFLLADFIFACTYTSVSTGEFS